jgi:16S rRNA G966 N2-methylase RsmD
VSTLRAVLAAATPHVSVKAALTALIRTSRALRGEGHAVVVRGRADIERWLGQEDTGQFDLVAIKALMHGLVHGENLEVKTEAALTLNQIIAHFTPKEQSLPTRLSVSGGPAWLTTSKIDRWLGTEAGEITLTPGEAAAWVHHIDGLNIGSQKIRATAHLDEGHILPPLRREQRGRQRTSTPGCWLPFTDEVGRISATPERIAMAHGDLLAKPGLPVLDPCCGLGADAIGAALSGATVLASDTDSGRLALARRNADHFGVTQAIQFELGTAEDALRRWTINHPAHTIFLDPPWGGVNWSRDQMDLDMLFSNVGDLRGMMAHASRVVIKLPRTFDTSSLDGLGRQWKFCLGIASIDDHMADRVRLITATSDDCQ